MEGAGSVPCRRSACPSFLGSCVTGYVGERCQFSDLEWWEQHRSGRAKVRSIAITAGAAALALLLLLLAALAAYCRRYCRQHRGALLLLPLLLLSPRAGGSERELPLS